MKTRLTICLLIIVVVWTLGGCITQPSKIAPTSTVQNLPSPVPKTLTRVPTVVPSKPVRQMGSDDESVERLPLPTITPTPIPTIPSPPGIQYTTNNGQWVVTQDGSSVRIVGERCAIISPDRTLAVMSYCAPHANSYLLDLHTEITTTLTDAEEYVWSPDSRQSVLHGVG